MTRIITATVVITALLTGPAFAQVPNHADTVRAVSSAFAIGTHDGLAAFVDAAVCALHQRDSRWGHLKKNPGQTQTHGHAEDAALYHHPQGLLQAVDFVGSAGAPNASVGWLVDEPRYQAGDWLPPHNCGSPAPNDPLPPAVDLSAVLTKLDALSAQIHNLSIQIADVGEQAEQARTVAQSARDRIEDTLKAVDLARQQINRPPLYTGRIFGASVTFRPTVHPANPIP